MFLLNEILVFTPGRRQEGLDRLTHIHGLMSPKPGFREAIVGRYLGDGIKHTVLRLWEDEAAYLAFRAGPDGNYGRGRPEGLYGNEPVIPQWNSVFEQSTGERGNFLFKVQREQPEDGWDAYLHFAGEVAGLMGELGGMESVSIFRAKDRTESLAIVRFRERADYERMLDNADYAKLLATLPPAPATSPRQCFDVVGDVAPS